MDVLLRQPLDRLSLTFFDLETTGLSPAQGHRICEVAFLRAHGEHIEYRFDELVNPQRPLDPRAFAINGITPDLLNSAPLFVDLAPVINEALQDSILVAHNAPFDMAFLEHEFALLGQCVPVAYVIDTLRLARRLMQRSSYSLHALSSDLHLDLPAHRAMRDVQSLQGLFGYLLPRLHDLGIITLEDVLRYQRGLLPGQSEPAPPPLIDQALREGCLLRITYRSRSSPQATDRVVQPRELYHGKRGVCLVAYCYLRHDMRTFAIDKIESMELMK